MRWGLRSLEGVMLYLCGFADLMPLSYSPLCAFSTKDPPRRCAKVGVQTTRLVRRCLHPSPLCAAVPLGAECSINSCHWGPVRTCNR